jgi:hypothetical protein
MCLILGVLASNFVMPFALAAEKQAAHAPLGEKVATSLDAMKKANDYSFKTGGIGILIGYGTGNGEGVTAEAIGDQFVTEIKKRGMKSRYFYYVADWRGMTVEYHIGYSALGPWSVDEAAANVSKAVARAKAAQNVHNR